MHRCAKVLSQRLKGIRLRKLVNMVKVGKRCRIPDADVVAGDLLVTTIKFRVAFRGQFFVSASQYFGLSAISFSTS